MLAESAAGASSPARSRRRARRTRPGTSCFSSPTTSGRCWTRSPPRATIGRARADARRARARHAGARDLPRLAGAERRPRRRHRAAPPRGVGDDTHKETPGVFAEHDVDVLGGHEARVDPRRAHATVKSHHHQGFGRARRRACASRRAPTTARSKRSRTRSAASRSACSGTRRRARTCALFEALVARGAALPRRPLSGLAELVPTLPDPVRAVLRNAVWTYGTRDRRRRGRCPTS